MSTPAITIEVTGSVSQARELMRLRRVHHLVVTDQGRPVGVLSSHDVGGDGRAIADVMSGSLVTATPETSVRAAANLLRGRQVGCLPVLEGRKLVGLVSVSDLLELLGKGAERPVLRSTRWTLKHRGPRRKTTLAERSAP